MPRKTPGPPCQACGAPSVAKGLCDKHYRRQKQYGNVDTTLRPDDWGQRHKHPLWHSWKWTSRAGRVKRWDGFWDFVADVGERPERSILKRYKPDLPFGPDNFFWSDPSTSDADLKTLEGRAKYMREWSRKNPVKTKGYRLKKAYGIGYDEYSAMAVKQGGGCAICGQKDEWFNLAVDHCHEKGFVRGLLCGQCNKGLGLFADNPERLRAAAAYLERNQRLI